MFTADDKDRFQSFVKGKFNFYIIQLRHHALNFICETLDFDEDLDEFTGKSTFLIGDLGRLYEFVKENETLNVYILFQESSKNTKSLTLQPLKSIAIAEYYLDGTLSQIQRYESDNGNYTYLPTDDSVKDIDTLQFLTILEFS